jgi:hypothetical protein
VIVQAQARVINPNLVDDKRDKPYIQSNMMEHIYYKEYDGKEEKMYRAMVEYMKTHFAKPKSYISYMLILVKGKQEQVKPMVPNRPQFPKKINALEDEDFMDEDISGEYPNGDELETSRSKH